MGLPWQPLGIKEFKGDKERCTVCPPLPGGRYANSSGRRRVRELPSRCPVCWILLGRTPDVVVTLFHVLKPMPRGLLEHGGSENPAAKAQLSVQLHDEQEAWIRKERESECHILKQAWETLAQSGFDMGHVAVKYGHDDDIARNILEEARSGQHDTIVVGRQGYLGSNRSSAAHNRSFSARREGLCDLGGGVKRPM